VGAVVLVLAVPVVGLAAETQFDFADLSATLGPGTLAYANDTASAVAFGTASSFGLPALPGGDSAVMKFAAFAEETQGLLFDTGCAGNGGGGGVNQYTMIWDLLVPSVTASSYMSFYNTAPANDNDGEFFIKAETRGIGISSVYDGTILDGTWHRVALVVDAGGTSGNTHYKYIDGAMVGQQSATGGVDGRFALYPTGMAEKTWLFGDEDGETNAGYISSYYFVDRMLTANEIGVLGRPDADGAVPEPSTLVLLAAGMVSLLLLRRKRG
jgi:hypothetical protein